MEAKLQIGDISLLFIYQFHDYFGNELEQYRINDLNEDHYTLEVLVKDEIEAITGNNRVVFNNRIKIRKDETTYIEAYSKDNTINHQISFTNDYKQCSIILNRNLGKKLAETEYVLSGLIFFEIAIRNCYLPIHASAIALNDYAVLLSGPSRSGKSTQTKYFQQVFPQSIIINEDKPLIYERDSTLYVCGSPWSGKHVISKNIGIPLRYILFINQSKEINIVKMDIKEKMKQLMKNIHRSDLEEQVDKTLYLIEKIIEDIDVVRYDCVNDISSSQHLKQYLEANYEN